MQQFAKLFVHYRDALTLHTDSSRNMHLDEWNELPTVEREGMVAAARLALIEIESAEPMNEDSSRYYAKPGEAEWGC